MSFAFPPRGWALCDGQLLPISQNQALYDLIGTRYGGDGRVNFGLPDLRGRTPIHVGPGYPLGTKGGEQSHALKLEEMPMHTHVLYGTNSSATIDSPDAGQLLATASIDMYRAPTNLVAMETGCIAGVGGGQAHENMQPFITLSFCIALQGVSPDPNPNPPT